MRLTGPALAKDEQIGAAVDPALAGRQRQDVGFTNTGGGVEVEVGQALARRQAGFGEMALDTPGRAIGQLDLDQAGEQLGRRPAFLVSGLGEAFPVPPDTGQMQGGQQGWQDGGVGVGASHEQACAGKRAPGSRWL